MTSLAIGENIITANHFQKMLLCIDPAKTNMGLWIGDVSTDLISKTTSLSKISLDKRLPLYKSAIVFLEKNVDFSEITKVIIEQQPTKNKATCILAASLYGYFYGRKIECRMCSLPAKQKTIMKILEKYQMMPRTDLCPYRNNKANSVLAVTRHVKEIQDEIALNIISSEKKKDDICDAMILAFSEYI